MAIRRYLNYLNPVGVFLLLAIATNRVESRQLSKHCLTGYILADLSENHGGRIPDQPCYGYYYISSYISHDVSVFHCLTIFSPTIYKWVGRSKCYSMEECYLPIQFEGSDTFDPCLGWEYLEIINIDMTLED